MNQCLVSRVTANCTTMRADGQKEQYISQKAKDEMVANLYLYGAEGVILAFVNLPIVMLIAYFALLRRQKEMVMVGGLSLADGFHGVALIVASVGRIVIIESGNGFVLISRWECLLKPWNLFFIFSLPLAPIMLLMISIDRLLAVSSPFKYHNFTNAYAMKLVMGFFSSILPIAIACIVTSHQHQQNENPAYCLIHHACADGYLYFLYALRIGSASLSVLLFVPILVILQKETRLGSSSKAAARQMRRLRSITITLGISSSFSVIFLIVPDILFILPFIFPQIPTVSSLILFGLNNCNAIANIFLYTMRFKDIRTCAKNLVSFSVISQRFSRQRTTSQPYSL